MSVFSSNSFALLGEGAGSNLNVPASKGKQAQQQQPKPKAAPLPERARPSERAIRPSYPARGGYRGANRDPRAVDAPAAEAEAP
ncbi:hypothetical protein IWQ57_003588, partial [Coemansia nantahalensis]